MAPRLALLTFASLLVTACGSTDGPAPEEAGTVHSFELVETGALPEAWQVAETNGRGRPASWEVARDPSAPHGVKVLRLARTSNVRHTYNLLLLPGTVPATAHLGVHVQAGSGVEDQGGGLVWRVQDLQNYYVARWNPLEDNVRAYKVVEGRRVQLGHATVRADPGAWHALDVETWGIYMRVSFDGRELFTCADDTFREGGRVGLWTKADAATAFDRLRIRTR